MDAERRGLLKELGYFFHRPLRRPVADIDVEMLLQSTCGKCEIIVRVVFFSLNEWRNLGRAKITKITIFGFENISCSVFIRHFAIFKLLRSDSDHLAVSYHQPRVHQRCHSYSGKRKNQQKQQQQQLSQNDDFHLPSLTFFSDSNSRSTTSWGKSLRFLRRTTPSSSNELRKDPWLWNNYRSAGNWKRGGGK